MLRSWRSPTAKAYKMIRQWNEELRAKGYATVNGRVSRQYYLEHMYGMTENKMNHMIQNKERTALNPSVAAEGE